MSLRNKSKGKTQPVKAFLLFEFLNEEEPDEQRIKEIDFARSWIFCDEDQKNTVTVFIPPPYNGEKCKLLHDLVKSESSPPDDWPTYAITIKGHAGEDSIFFSLKKSSFIYFYIIICSTYKYKQNKRF